MITIKHSSYTNESMHILEHALLQGFYSIPCNDECINCKNKIVCADIYAAYSYVKVMANDLDHTRAVRDKTRHSSTNRDKKS